MPTLDEEELDKFRNLIERTNTNLRPSIHVPIPIKLAEALLAKIEGLSIKVDYADSRIEELETKLENVRSTVITKAKKT